MGASELSMKLLIEFNPLEFNSCAFKTEEVSKNMGIT